MREFALPSKSKLRKGIGYSMQLRVFPFVIFMYHKRVEEKMATVII